MILVCEACRGRYLVPATVFANGPRAVRCARCGHVWYASLPPETRTVVNAPSPTPANNQPTQEPNATIPSPSVPLPPLTEPPETTPPIPQGSGLPTVWHEPIWNQIARGSLFVLIIALFSMMLWSVVDRDLIAKRWPATEMLYEVLGLASAHPGEGLILSNINSERRNEGNDTLLVVSGEIHNDSGETQNLPNLYAIALGADGRAILHWQIEAPVAKLDAGGSATFHSSQHAPADPVTEVNLSFVESADHDDGTQP